MKPQPDLRHSPRNSIGELACLSRLFIERGENAGRLTESLLTWFCRAFD